MEENRRPRFRFRIRTLLLVVAIVALLMLVVVQQVQIEKMRRLLDARQKQINQLTTILREMRAFVERRR